MVVSSSPPTLLKILALPLVTHAGVRTLWSCLTGSRCQTEFTFSFFKLKMGKSHHFDWGHCRWGSSG
jgi:hypothetical protein